METRLHLLNDKPPLNVKERENKQPKLFRVAPSESWPLLLAGYFAARASLMTWPEARVLAQRSAQGKRS